MEENGIGVKINLRGKSRLLRRRERKTSLAPSPVIAFTVPHETPNNVHIVGEKVDFYLGVRTKITSRKKE